MKWISLAAVVVLVSKVSTFSMTGQSSYASFPPWNGCANASFTFEVKTTLRDTLLWYADDGGTYDFIQIEMSNGRIRLLLNTEDGKDGRVVEIMVGHNLNDNQWHKIKLKRRRMQTILSVDTLSERRDAMGADVNFGGKGRNSHVFIGGLPEEFKQNLENLALPSVMFIPRFRGSVRNIIYRNCSCSKVRVPMIDGVGVSLIPPENCEIRNPCREGCICESTDTTPKCDCEDLECMLGNVTHYELPMDRVVGTTLANPSGLDASAFGSPHFNRGVRGNAMEVNGMDKYIRVSASGHRMECLGDLAKCSNGYTLAFWVNFTNPVADGEYVFLSNGGHSSQNHGVAMLYNNRGNLEFRFKKTSGEEWSVNAEEILPGRWYHVAATWSQKEGLWLYINGHFVDSKQVATRSQAVELETDFNDFLIGRPNDAVQIREKHSMWVDEFNFWSMFKNASEIRELGPFYSFIFPMNALDGSDIRGGQATISGNPQLIVGKMGNAFHFDGKRSHINGSDQSETCFGNLTLCQYGLTTAMWIRFSDIQDNMYILSTGNGGVNMYVKNGKLTAEAQQGLKNWQATWAQPLERDRWYFVEMTWDHIEGVQIFVDLEQVTQSTGFRSRESRIETSNLYIGRANTDMSSEKFASATIDDLEIWYGDRETLVYLDFLSRGRPMKHYLGMDSIANNRVVHPNLRIDVLGQAQIEPGKIDGALSLDGSDFVSLGRQSENCFGNLDLCRHGLLLSMWLRPGQLKNGMEFLSTGSNGIKARYVGGQLRVTARTTTHEWNLQTDKLNMDEWQFVEFGWDRNNGLSLYSNQKLIAQGAVASKRSTTDDSNPERHEFYIGRGDGTQSGARYGNFTIDDVEYWYGNRDFLIAFDYIFRGTPFRFWIDMDKIENNEVVHPDLSIPVFGNPVVVPGKVNGGIRLDGSGQYIDAGADTNTCLGNLEKCNHGVTGSMFLNFRNLQDGMYYVSNGGGIKMYYKNGRLYVAADLADKLWEVGIPNLQKDKWYFVEFTWHPEKGLQVFLNNKLVEDKKMPISTLKKPVGGHFLIGKANDRDADPTRFKFPDTLVDELEVWFRDRDNLIAFDHILRGNVTHITFPLEQQRGNKVIHPDYTITLHNGATLVPGKVGNGAQLEGTGEYLTFGEQLNNCMGDLEKCPHGMTIIFYLNANELEENGYFLAGGPYSVYSKNNKVFAKFSTSTKTWEVSTDKINLNKWHKVELSWDEEKGLQMFVDKTKVASTTEFNTHPPLRITDHMLYLGRPTEDLDGRYANAKVDELEYWFANRDHLIAFDLIGDDIERLIVDMDNIKGDILVHPTHVIYVGGSPETTPGVIDNAISLDGVNQYVDLGQNIVCKGNLQNCPKGFTLRFKIKPDELLDNTYFFSSIPMDVFYQNNRLTAEARTPSNVWQVSTPSLNRNEWNQVDVSWHPVDGLVLYINGVRMDRQTSGQRLEGSYDTSKVFYIGRANTNMIREHYANADFDDVQLWEAKRDYLIPDLINPDEDQKLIANVPTATTPVPTVLPDGKKWLMFDGDTYLTYDFSLLPEGYMNDNTNESFHVRFQTDKPEGLIWYTGKPDNYTLLFLKDGVLYLISNTTTSSGVFQDVLKAQTPDRLDDNRWHDVYITKQGRLIKIKLDDYNFERQSRSNVDFVSPNQVYLGGSENTYILTKNQISRNFEGTVTEAVMTGDTLPGELDLIHMSLIKPLPKYIFVDGNPVYIDPYDTTTTISPAGREGCVTFSTAQSYITLPKWAASLSGTIELDFQTVASTGLLLFNGGNPDSFSLEIFDGIPYVNLDLGKGNVKYPFDMGAGRVNDGRLHHVKIDRKSNILKLTLDDRNRVHNVATGDGYLDLGTMLFVGGVDYQSRLPWQVWSRNDMYYRGCVCGLKINGGEIVNLEKISVESGIDSGCSTFSTDCQDLPCDNNGMCHERWDGFYCDCSSTPYTGKNCDKMAPIGGFGGNEYVHTNFNQTLVTHTNDISVRFKTLKEDGLLLATSNNRNGDYLRVSLEGGSGKVETNLGGQTLPIYVVCEDPLNDNQWHTFYIKRRANYLEAYVDDCTKASTDLRGSGFTLEIDKLVMAKRGRDDSTRNTYVGHMQNVHFQNYSIFEIIGRGDAGVVIDSNANITIRETALVIFPATFRLHAESFVKLPTLQILGDTSIQMMMKTSDGNGLLLYNEGSGGDFFAVELVNGALQVSANDGSGARVVKTTGASLADSRWHIIEIKQTSERSFSVMVDGKSEPSLSFQTSRNTLDLVSFLYFGGVPVAMQNRLPSSIASSKGFSGCLATVVINGKLYDLLNDDFQTSQYVTSGCTDTKTFCSADMCQHYGICLEGQNTYRCDCNMTSFERPVCDAEAEGYRYGLAGGSGISIFKITPPQDTTADNLAFGFMTWQQNGTLVRVESSTPGDFIEAKLENGHVVFMYDVGDGTQRIVESGRTFNDGQYHYATFVRKGGSATVRVDDFPTQQRSGSSSAAFNNMHFVKIGGNLDGNNNIINYFDGIISGVYLNGYRVIDLGMSGGGQMIVRGDTVTASHPFFVAQPRPPVTQAPPGPGPDEGFIPGEVGGGGGWNGDEVIIVPDVGQPEAGAMVGGAPGWVSEAEGPRAAAVAGAMIGLLVAASSIMWAFYKFKPGLVGGGLSGVLNISAPTASSTSYKLVNQESTPFIGSGAGQGGGSGGGLDAADGHANALGAGSKSGYNSTSFTNQKMDTLNGYGAGQSRSFATQTAAGSTNLAEYFQSITSSSSVAATAVSGHKAGTIERGIQTDLGHAMQGQGQSTFVDGQALSSVRSATVINEYNSQQMAGADSFRGQQMAGADSFRGQQMAGADSFRGQQMQGYDAYGNQQMVSNAYNTGNFVQNQTLPMSNYSQSYSETAAFNGATIQGGQRQLSPPPQVADASGIYQMRNMTLNYSAYSQQEMIHQQQLQMQHQQQLLQQQQQQLNYSSASNVSKPNLMTSEEIRVDCVQLTTNGRYVVTGSIYGPPQVWDMKSGELVRIMQGEDFSSTDLHLANGDTLLVGQVAEQEQAQQTVRSASPTNPMHYRKLQIWDFNSGRPMEMRRNETCTASCLMSDGERMVLGRTEKFGGGTTIVIWDVLGNEPIRHIRWDNSVGFADPISYINPSKDNRYIIAGFQNSFDGKANYILFDLTVTDFNRVQPNVIALNAQVEVTTVLENQEAVTGTRAGELVIWSMRTGKALRQLVTPSRDGFGQAAHQREVMCLSQSKDGQYLVSASADMTLKLWSLELEKLIRSFVGHKDEVWCCAIANDNEIVISGSKDCTIRLWRLEDGAMIAAINTVVDVFKVLLSNNKKTVVALADKFGARKLIMLQVVRTMVRSATGSRATSPLLASDSNLRY